MSKTATRNGAVGPNPSNAAERLIQMDNPYRVEFTIEGTADLLFHRWQNEVVAEGQTPVKNSKKKKTDDIESYVFRGPDERTLCIPGEYIRGSICTAAKRLQDPVSPRKSALDLFKAGIVVLTDLAPLMRDGKELVDWNYVHRCRVTIQRNAITRARPAFYKGWQATFVVLVNAPEYIDEGMLRLAVDRAGKMVGVADFRPTYGRYDVVSWRRIQDDE